jgi:L-2-deoxyfucosyltransferase
MRVLFATFASKSHMFAYVPMAWALRAAGHEVCVASQPDLVDDITRTGLTAVPVGYPLNLEAELREMDEVRDEVESSQGYEVEWASWVDVLDIGEWRPERFTAEHVQAVLTAHTSLIFQYFSLQTTMDDLVGFARAWRPDLVIWDTMTFAGPVAAMACGAAHARLLFGLDLVGRMRQAYLGLLAGRPADARDDPMEEWLAPALDRYGCEFSEEAVVGQWTIDPVPASLRLPVGLLTVPVRYIPYNGPATIRPQRLGREAVARDDPRPGAAPVQRATLTYPPAERVGVIVLGPQQQRVGVVPDPEDPLEAA